MKRAQKNGIVDLHIHNLRDWTTDKHHVADDAPFGGGQGMVMKPEPIFAAVEELPKSNIEHQRSKIESVLMSPAGRRFDQQMAAQLSGESHLIIICGHYEGVDHRVIEHWSISKFPSAITCSPTVRLRRSCLSMQSCVCCRAFLVTSNPRLTIVSSRITGSAAVHAPGGVSRLESPGRFAFRKSCRNREVAKRAGDQANAGESSGFARMNLTHRVSEREA